MADPAQNRTTTPYEDGDGTEVARLARERRCANLVQELRGMGGPLGAPVAHAAADEIERLRWQVDFLESLLDEARRRN